MLVDLITQQSSRLVVPVYQRPYSWSEENPGNRVGRDFAAGLPNFLWLTDVTQFSIPAGKLYLSPVLDCFDGPVVSWVTPTSPNAEMADGMPRAVPATTTEAERAHLVTHSDCGCRCRRPGRAAICEEAGVTGSVSRKGCSPDNSRTEGFFGTMKTEMSCGRDWSGVTLEELASRTGSLHRAPQHREDKALARRDEPASVQEEPGPRGVGSGYGKTVPPPFAQFELTRHR